MSEQPLFPTEFHDPEGDLRNENDNLRLQVKNTTSRLEAAEKTLQERQAEWSQTAAYMNGRVNELAEEVDRLEAECKAGEELVTLSLKLINHLIQREDKRS
jgi:hypothetical protein